jgi:2-methylcitrate dehydratase PrpD
MEQLMTGEVTRTLARFAANLDYDAIPETVRDYCKDLLLDALACALAGHRGEETHQVGALASALGQSRESSVIGGDGLTLAGATLLNGYLITAVTMCDVHRATLTHITPEVVPPALAIAERDQLSGRELLVALAAGFEITTRVGMGLNFPAFRARGWHGPGVIGPFGGAAAVGRLLRFDGDTMATAFGLAGSQAAGTFAAWGTPTVKFHQCRGALSGLMAALLAQQKFVATREFLTASDGGLYPTYAGGGQPEAAVKDLGERWELLQVALRPWPSASTIQGLITAMFDLLERNRLSAENVKRLRVRVGKTAFDMHGIFPRYRGKFEALLSIHYVAAVILHDRSLTLDQFEPQRYNDAKLRRFAAEQVKVECDNTLSGVQAVIEADMLDGTTASMRCDHPRGAPENRLTRAQVEDKLRVYARERLDEPRTGKAIEALSSLEKMESVRTLMQLLRRHDTPSRRAAAAA